MIIPFVLLVSLIMNILIENQNGSNPLLEIVLIIIIICIYSFIFNNYIFSTIFEEIIFRGVLLPILSREFGITWF